MNKRDFGNTNSDFVDNFTRSCEANLTKLQSTKMDLGLTPAQNTTVTKSLAANQRSDTLLTEDTESAVRQLARCSSAKARECVSREKALRFQILPLSVSQDCIGEPILTVLTTAERESEAYQALRFLFSGSVQTERAPRHLDIDRAIRYAYDGELIAVQRAIVQATHAEISDGAIGKLVAAIIARARARNASDIHIVPTSELAKSTVSTDNRFLIMFRVNGRLQVEDGMRLSSEVGWSLIRRLKVMANLDLTINFQPQEGACVIEEDQKTHRLRLSVIPTVGGPKLALRLLGSSADGAATDFRSMGMTLEQERTLKAALGLGGGVVLCVGPTGSGKSTLLHAVLRYLHRPELHVVTIEDPVERFIPGVSQCELDADRGLTYSSIFRATLRQDPDIIMLGEIRDRETAELAFSAGLSGHLILSTLHSGSCLEAFSRLAQLGVSAELCALSLRLLIAQRLFPLNCRNCLTSQPVTSVLQNYLRLEEATHIYFGAGCSACEFTGWSGRAGVFEMLMCTEAVKREARRFMVSHDLYSFHEAVQEHRYEPFSWRIREALIDGRTDARGALGVLGLNPEIFGY